MATHYASGEGVFTPEGYAAALARFGDSLRPAILRAAKRSIRIPAAIAMQKFRKDGIGRAIFGRGFGRQGTRGLMRTKVVQQGSLVVMALELRGFAALQETGGRTNAHIIRPKHGKALKLKVPSVGIVVRREVHHPGSRIKRIPFAVEAMVAAAPRIQAALDREICVFTSNGVRIAESRVVA
jgi:hypothetical protein